MNSIRIGRQIHPQHDDVTCGDIQIDDRPLADHFEGARGLVSPIGWATDAYVREHCNRLLLRAQSVLPSGRRELLVCPICADFGCGCVSANIYVDGDDFVWDEIGWENDYDDDSLLTFNAKTFRFPIDRLEYVVSLEINMLK